MCSVAPEHSATLLGHAVSVTSILLRRNKLDHIKHCTQGAVGLLPLQLISAVPLRHTGATATAAAALSTIRLHGTVHAFAHS